jgi:hypothetical protein
MRKAALELGRKSAAHASIEARVRKPGPYWGLEELQYEQHYNDYHHNSYYCAGHPSPPPPDGFPRGAW